MPLKGGGSVTSYLDDFWAMEMHGPPSVHWRGSLGELSQSCPAKGQGWQRQGLCSQWQEHRFPGAIFMRPS